MQPHAMNHVGPGPTAAGAWLCLLGALILLGAPWIEIITLGAGRPHLGGAGPIPWAATVAVAAGALWGQGVRLTGWGSRGRALGALAGLALPLGVTLLGLGAVESGPLPLGRLPSPHGAAEALAGLMGAGVFLGLGRFGGWAPVWALAAAALLDGAPAGWGLLEGAPGSGHGEAPWGPGLAAGLLDGSPRAFVMESGGVDWMRHPDVYGPVGTDRIGPDLRTGWIGSSVPRITLLLAYLLVGWRCLRAPKSPVIEGLEAESLGP